MRQLSAAVPVAVLALVATLVPQAASAAEETTFYTQAQILPYRGEDYQPKLADYATNPPVLQKDGRVVAQQAEPQDGSTANPEQNVYHSYLPGAKATKSRGASAAAAKDYLTKKQCLDKELPDPETEWAFKNHFAACQRARYIIVNNVCTTEGPCQPVGAWEARAVILGFGSQDGRNIQFELFLDEWKEVGRTPDIKTVVKFDFECARPSIEVSCKTQTPLPETSVTKTIEGWQQDGFYRFAMNPTSAYGEDDADKHYLDNVQRYAYNLTAEVTYVGGTVVNQELDFPSVLVRCDNAAYVTGRQCLFPEVTAVLHLDYDEPTYKQSVEFIHQAMHDLESLNGGITGLYVPGGLYEQFYTGRFEPLTRNYYGNRSRTKVQAECRRLYGADYTSPGADGVARDCDEYPFSATYENANYDDPGTAASWAVKALNKDHNQKLGRLLGEWYTADGILDGDEYFVQIDNVED